MPDSGADERDDPALRALAADIGVLVERLTELRIERLREALGSARPDVPAATALDKRLGRARRSLEKAAQILDPEHEALDA
jgi:hypothetical protein